LQRIALARPRVITLRWNIHWNVGEAGNRMSADLEEVRVRVRPVLERAKADEAYAERLRADPEGQLRDAGIPSEWITNVAGEITHDGPATEEAMRPAIWCTVWSCIFTAWWE
jgi:hypothetical protein